MKKTIGPDNSTQEFETVVESPKRPRNNNNNKKNKKVPNKDGKKDWSFYAIVICLVIILIPSLFVGITIFRASKGTGRPVFGHRFDNDLKPKIEKNDLKQLETNLAKIENVDKISVELKTATVRIYLNMPEVKDKEVIAKAGNQAEEILLSDLDVASYFTATESQLQYDYEIYAHNTPGEDAIIYLVNKTSRMEKAHKQYLSDPVSKEMVDELWEIQNNRDNPVVDESIEEDEPEE